MPRNNNGIYYFLGNITSHILHALPLYKELGGTFVVLSEKAKKEVAAYGVPVINLNNAPYVWKRFGWRIKPIYHYLELGKNLRKTSDYLNENATTVIFYELYDFNPSIRITKPNTVFLTHGNMLKDYMASSNRLKIFEQYDYMVSLGPFLKDKFIKQDGIDPKKLVDLGIARSDEIVANAGKTVLPKSFVVSGDINPHKPILSYMPTFWGASSIYTVGKEIVRHFPDDYTLIFRPHPQTPKKILQEYFDIMSNKPNVLYAPEGKYAGVGLSELIAASAGIIGDVSSVMLEAVLTDKPLFFAFDTGKNRQPESDYTAIREVVSFSPEITVENVKNLQKIIKNGLKNGVDKKIWKITKDRTFYHNDGTSVAAITAFIHSLTV